MARRLRVLVLRDDVQTQRTSMHFLGTDDLDLLSVEDDSGQLHDIVDSWWLVLELLGDVAQAERPDIVLVDVWFGADTTQPLPLPDLQEGDEKDPRGLLYGAILLAKYRGESRLPLAFAPFSQGAEVVADRTDAQTYYALLATQSGSVDHPAHGGDQFQRQLKRMRSSRSPEDVAPEVLRSYREQLARCFQHEVFLDPDGAAFAAAAQAIRAFVQDGVPIDESVVLEWSGGETRDSVLLTSIYADCRRNGSWDKTSLVDADAAQFLDDLANQCSVLERDVAATLKPALMAHAKQYQGQLGELAPVAWSAGPQNYWERATAFTLLWALDRANDGDATAVGLARLAMCGESEETARKSVTRSLGYVVNGTYRNTYPPGGFIRALDEAESWPSGYPERLGKMVVRCLKRIDGLSCETWPDALGGLD